MKTKYIIFTILIVISASCNEFVDIVPKGNTIPQTVDDLAKLMNCGTYDDYASAEVAISVTGLDYFTDNYYRSEDPAASVYLGKLTDMSLNFYKWKSNCEFAQTTNDSKWNNLYKSNYVVNYILENIEKVQDGQSYERNEVKGCALVHRAMNYFLLTNIYGKQYNSATSSTDLSVPLITVSDVNKQYARATVAQVYELIISDLDESISILKTDVPDYNQIPGRATAYALRARVNLWMKQYDKAYSDASEALKLRSKLTDYNSFNALLRPLYPMYGPLGYESEGALNEEVMYYRYRMTISSASFSDKLLSIIDTKNDLRYALFFGTRGTSYPDPISLSKIVHSGINTSEVWLIKAEAAVRKNSPDVSSAIEALDYVRSRRIATAAYIPTTETDPSTLLNLVLDERRRELTCTEMSFLDCKRLNSEPAFARDMSRTVFGEIYTMDADSPRWQLAIPLNVMNLNPLLIQNED